MRALCEWGAKKKREKICLIKAENAAIGKFFNVNRADFSLFYSCIHLVQSSLNNGLKKNVYSM